MINRVCSFWLSSVLNEQLSSLPWSWKLLAGTTDCFASSVFLDDSLHCAGTEQRMDTHSRCHPQWQTHHVFRQWCHALASLLGPLARSVPWDCSGEVTVMSCIKEISRWKEWWRALWADFHHSSIQQASIDQIYITLSVLLWAFLSLDGLAEIFPKMSPVIFLKLPPLPRQLYFSTLHGAIPPLLWPRVGSDKHKKNRTVTDPTKLWLVN